jgi:cholesterol transport system auxiliary component
MFMRLFWLLVGTFLLVSCSVLSPVKTDPIKEYIIDVSPYVHKSRSTSKAMAVSMPMSDRFYQSKNMVYSTRAYEFKSFAKNRWVESPMQMLQPLIIQALQNTHHYKAVAPAIGVGQFDYIINTQVLEFYQDFCVRGSVFKLKLRAQMIKVANGKILASKEFTAIQPALCPNPYGGVIAANQATSKILTEMAAWSNRYR